MGANKGINTPFFETVTASDLFLTLRLAARFMGINKRACLVRLQKTHAPMAMITLLTSIIKISLLYTSGPTVLTNGRVGLHEHLFLNAKRKENKFNQTK